MTRRAWRWILAGYVTLALGFTIVTAIVVHEIHRLDDTQRALQHTQGLIGAFVIRAAGAICLLGLAPTSEERRRLVESYVSGNQITLAALGPTCRTAADRAIEDLFDAHPPPEVKALK